MARTQDVITGIFRADKAAHVSPETYQDRIRRAEPKHGDLLYSREGTYFGIAAEVPADVQVCLGQRMVLIRPNPEKVHFRFLRYWLNSPVMAAHVHGHRDGSVAERLNLPTIRSLPVILPGVAEQAAVASTLGALDDKIALNKRIAAVADDLAMTLVSGGLWRERVRLDEICKLQKDQVAPQGITDETVDHYSLPAFDTGKLPERVSPESIKSGKFTVTEPSVLLSKLNPDIPRVWNVTPNPGVPSLASTEFLVLTPRGALSTHELWSVIGQRSFLEDIASKVTGTSKSHQRVRPTEVMTTEVVDPRQFGETGAQIRSLASRAVAAREESQTLAALRDTLLPQLMSGLLRVKDAEKIVEDHA
ncbi:restriction endonuclease subunit S [Streptomyces sp. ADI95-16]|uniref:restriction endonuclease subunit S n=1 Tax=Streptomyces sp. ADI95-16 TaxID=1522758 RepID=UPI0013DE5508|nr:restriction endonuclease subunit S [Streptomyces sp. ADI95-16]